MIQMLTRRGNGNTVQTMIFAQQLKLSFTQSQGFEDNLRLFDLIRQIYTDIHYTQPHHVPLLLITALRIHLHE
ncbi:hypothetical protein D3C76_1760280 [compost metagenome]